MAEKYCTSCGKALPDGARFCAACGAPVQGSGKEAGAAKKPVKKAGAKQRAKSTRTRDFVVIAGALVVVTVGWLAFRTPAQPPQPPTAQQGQGGHPEVEGNSMGGMMEGLENLPADYAGLVQAGNQFMDAGNYAVAAESYRRALAIDPSSPDVRTDFGACLHSMGLPERALEEFQTVILEHPEHGIANFNTGIVYLDMGKTDSARVYWEKYLKLDPNGIAADKARELLQSIDG